MMCDRTSANAIMGYDTVSDRILSVKFRGRKVNITIVQLCAPTSMASEEVQDSFSTNYKAPSTELQKGT